MLAPSGFPTKAFGNDKNFIIDTHAHIDQLADLEGALQRADEAGVSDIVAVSVDLDSMRKIADIANVHTRPRIHPAFGVHPGNIKPEESAGTQAFMRAHLKDAIAVGETGLDYQYKWARKDEAERNKQKTSFQMQLDLAREFDLPIIIHSRGAERDCLSMAKFSKIQRALFHWYSGPVDILDGILEAGYYVSTSPSVARSPQSRAAMAHAPLECILLETDTPVHFNDEQGGFDSEPKDVLKTLAALSALKGMEEATVLEQVNTNAKTFFRI